MTKKIFKRKIYQKMLQWKQSNGTTALLIKGARRIGKSTIAEEFAQNEYQSYIAIDFSIASEAATPAASPRAIQHGSMRSVEKPTWLPETGTGNNRFSTSLGTITP